MPQRLIYRGWRTRAGPKAWLGSYRGYLQADAHVGYDELFRTNRELIEVGCWAHARRYFFESKASDPSRALEALACIQQWYAVEKEASEQDRPSAAAIPSTVGQYGKRGRDRFWNRSM